MVHMMLFFYANILIYKNWNLKGEINVKKIIQKDIFKNNIDLKKDIIKESIFKIINSSDN